jgi:formylmethanofuran dehydrogenase subunit C
MTIQGDVTLLSRTLLDQGTINWTGENGSFTLAPLSGGKIVVDGGLFEVMNNLTMDTGVAAAPGIVNQLILKNGGILKKDVVEGPGTETAIGADSRQHPGGRNGNTEM